MQIARACKRVGCLGAAIALLFWSASAWAESDHHRSSSDSPPSSVSYPTNIDALWIAESDGVIKVSTATGRVILAIPDADNVEAIAVDESRTTLWVAGHNQLTAFGFDGHILFSLPIPPKTSEHGDKKHPQESSSENSGPASLAVDESDGSVWVGQGKAVYGIDSAGQLIAQIKQNRNVTALAVDSERGTIWVADGYGVAAYGKDGALRTSLPLGHEDEEHVQDIAVDAQTGNLFVALKNAVVAFSPAGQAVASYPSRHPRLIAVDSAGNLWVAVENSLSRFDRSGMPLFELEPFGHSDHILALVTDPKDLSAWVANTRKVAHVDATGQVTTTVKTDGQVQDLALYIDTIPPEIAFTQPPANSWQRNNMLSLGVAYSDIGIGIDPKSIEFTVNSLAMPVQCDMGSMIGLCAPLTPLPEGPVTVTVTIKDKVGNVSTPASLDFVVDTIPPAIAIAFPHNPYITNQSSILVSGSVSEWADLSVQGSAVTVGADLTFSAPVTLQENLNAVEVGAVDRAGNSSAQTLMITLDTVPPVVTAPPSVTQEASGPLTPVDIGSATAFDLVDGALTPWSDAPSLYPVGITTVTWSAQDAAGNVGTATQIVEVVDTTPPLVTPPANITIEATGPRTTVALGIATATDLVDGALTPSSDAPADFPVGTTTVTWSATDAAGNTGTATQTVTVVDTTPPAVTPPAAITIEATGPRTVVALGAATATDLVDGTLVPTSDAPVDFPVGTTTVTWSATDAAGNTGTATQTVTVVDTTPPTVTAPAAITIEATGPRTSVSLGMATATDLVDGSLIPTNNAPADFPVGTTTVTWSATDAAGNTGTATQKVTVVDTTPPTVTAPAAITIEATGPRTAVALGMATATDLVDGNLTPTSDAPADFSVGTTTVTWSASDAAGNTGSATQTVTVVDTTPPIVTAPANLTVEATGLRTALSSLGSATAIDAVVGPLTPVNNAPVDYPVGITTVLWSAADTVGNIGTASQTITVADTTPPTIAAPPAIERQSPDGNPVALDVGSANASDLVGPVNLSNNAPSQFPVGTTTVVWTAVDGFGNRAVAQQQVVVTAPPADIPPDPAVLAPPVIAPQDDFLTSHAFMLDPANRFQTDVAPGAIRADVAGVIRGKVIDVQGVAVAGVAVSVLNHPEFGVTHTRTDGVFDLLANAGGVWTVQYEKTGMLTALRHVETLAGDYVWIPDVALVAENPVLSNIDTSGPLSARVATSHTSNSQACARTTRLYFPTGVTAVSATNPSTPMSTFSVRVTERVGGGNEQAVSPTGDGFIDAPPYMADLSVAGHPEGVVFSQPVSLLVENYVGYPVGQPIGERSLDPATGQWIQNQPGFVLSILSGGGIDLTGDGLPETADILLQNGISTEEADWILGQYQAGQQVVRFPLSHFTDHSGSSNNSGTSGGGSGSGGTGSSGGGSGSGGSGSSSSGASGGSCSTNSLAYSYCPDTLVYTWENYSWHERDFCWSHDRQWNASGPGSCHYIFVSKEKAGAGNPFWRFTFKKVGMCEPDPNNPQTQQTCENKCKNPFGCPPNPPKQCPPITGSIIRPQGQSLGESAPITGTPYELVYTSIRAPGAVSENTVEIPLIGAAIPTGVIGVELVVEVAGRKFEYSYDAAANLSHTFTFDGLDAYGRRLQGRQHVTIRIGLRSAPDTTTTCSALFSPGKVSWTQHAAWVGGMEPTSDALGGWTLNVHHAFDSGDDGIVYRGDGEFRSGQHEDKVVATIVGDGTKGYSGDGGSALTAALNYPQGLALDGTGNLFVADSGNHVIRRIAPDGTIVTIAGTGVAGFSGDGAAATNATFYSPTAIAIDHEGNLLIADTFNNRIRKIDPNGVVTTIAGTGVKGIAGDGGPAVTAGLSYPVGIRIASNGSMYIADNNGATIRRIDAQGIIQTESTDGWNSWWRAGAIEDQDGALLIANASTHQVRRLLANGKWVPVGGTATRGFSGDGGAAQAATFTSPSGIAVAPDGTIYVADTGNHRIRVIRPIFSSHMRGGERWIASEDGSRISIFDAGGRHLRTLDALTGTALHTFTYDGQDRLIGIDDAYGNRTTIERDGNGNPTAIVSPDGLRTTLTLDGSGYLGSIADPMGNTRSYTYDAGGLMSTYTDPNGGVHRFGYDAMGRLIRDENPDGGAQVLSRQNREAGFTVSATTAEGHTSTFDVDYTPGMGELRTNTDASGGSFTSTKSPAGTTTTSTSTQGVVTTGTTAPDPRFGQQAPLTASQTVAMPSGLKKVTQTNRQSVLADPNDPLSLQTQIDTVSQNGRVTTSTFDAASRTTTVTTPEGRVSTIRKTALGAVEEVVSAGKNFSFTYDTSGRLTDIYRGSGTSTRHGNYGYAPEGWLSTVTDPLGRTVSFARDAAGRVTRQTLPDGRAVDFAYDGKGNLTSITPPGRTPHRFVYTPADQASDYLPPDLGSTPVGTQYRYNLDHQLTQILRPDGGVLDYGYDAGGRLSTLTLPDVVLNYSYGTGGCGSCGGGAKPQTIARTSNGTTEQLDYGFDGSLLLSETATGTITGTIGWTYDANFWVTGLTVNGQSIALNYDLDGLLTQAGDLTLTREPTSGFLTDTTLGSTTTHWTYNPFGEVASFAAVDAGSNLLSDTYVRDALGRIIQKTETIQGATTTYDYGYDLAGRLSEVKENGTVVASYQYDANGNRIGGSDRFGVINATVDAQDRLLDYAGNGYTYSANGDLQTKTASTGTTTYTYDLLGNLTKVVLPSGQVIEYVIDGRNRRVGKKVDGVLVQGFLYQDQLNPVAELDGSGSVVATFVYGAKANVPSYMVKGGVTYRIVSDHLGSPRLVVNSADGTIAQRVDYDEWGNVLFDSNPGFQPFGFAGGIADQDTCLIRFGARDYDPETGRWTAKDPILFDGRDANVYGYVFADPVNKFDPDGRIGYDLTSMFSNVWNWYRDTPAMHWTRPPLRPDGRVWGSGCGDETWDHIVPDYFPQSCNSHDQCYTNQCGKSVCDNNFLNNMKGERPDIPSIVPYIYYFSVRSLGGNAYKDAGQQ